MKRVISVFLLLLPLFMMAQNDFSYDTIRVSRDDVRNIHQSQRMADNQPPIYPDQPILGVQNQGFRFDKHRLRFGGNLGLSISKNYSVFKLAPQVGYQFSKYVMAGVGAGYTFQKHRFWQNDDRHLYKNNYLGTNVFAHLYPIRFLAISARPEINYMWQSIENEATRMKYKNNGWVPSLVLGAGLRMGNTHAMLYYDVIGADNSPYPGHLFYGFGVYF